MSDIDEVTIEIAPHLSGHITPRGLIEPEGTIELRTNYSNLTGPGTHFFCRVLNRHYHFEIGHTPTHFYILRNSGRLEVPIMPVYAPAGEVLVVAAWTLTQLRLTVLDDGYVATAKSLNEDEKLSEVQKRTFITSTPPTIPPNSLLQWARAQSILPTRNYDSLDAFNAVVASSLEAITDPVSNLGAINSFWDITYQGLTIINRQPKREVDIHPTIHNLLFYIAIAKNLEVVREYPIAGGQLDFLISAPLANGSTAHACVEFKYAHSNDIVHGLLKQLPAYMKAKGCDFGVYCIPYFKGPHFQEPHDYDSIGLRMLLEREKRAAGLRNIRTLVFDFSRPRSPSKL